MGSLFITTDLFHFLLSAGLTPGAAFFWSEVPMMALNVVFGSGFGWIIGPERSPRLPPRANPYDNEPANPFGSAPDDYRSDLNPADRKPGGDDGPPLF